MKDDAAQRTLTYLTAIFEWPADGLMVCDADGIILKLNKVVEIL